MFVIINTAMCLQFNRDDVFYIFFPWGHFMDLPPEPVVTP